jgi:hypothetical protein
VFKFDENGDPFNQNNGYNPGSLYANSIPLYDPKSEVQNAFIQNKSLLNEFGIAENDEMILGNGSYSEKLRMPYKNV